MKILDKKSYLSSAVKFAGVRMPNGLDGKIIQYRTHDVDGKIFNHHPIAAEKINWMIRVFNESCMMFTPQFLGRVFVYVVLEG